MWSIDHCQCDVLDEEQGRAAPVLSVLLKGLWLTECDAAVYRLEAIPVVGFVELFERGRAVIGAGKRRGKGSTARLGHQLLEPPVGAFHRDELRPKGKGDEPQNEG